MAERTPPFVVAIFNSTPMGETFLGTGWYVAPKRVLTCKHVVMDGIGELAETFTVRAKDGDASQVTGNVYPSERHDLAVLMVENSEDYAPALLHGLTLDLVPEFRSCPLSVFGYEQPGVEHGLKSYLLHESLLLAGANAESETVMDIQLAGGIPSGFSGGPVLLRSDDGWICAGIVRLGGERAAASRLIGPDTIKDFLDELGVHPRLVPAPEAIRRRSLDRVGMDQLEMRQLAVMFTDMADSTEFAERFGSMAAFEKRKRHNDLLIPILQAHRGTLVEIIGDALLVIFDSASDAAHCAVEMQRCLSTYNESTKIDIEELEIHIRVGIHFGKALVTRENGRTQIVGRAVNVAARVESGGAKQTDQILVSDAVMEQIAEDSGFVCQPFGLIPAKGVGTLRLHRLLWDEAELAETKSPEIPKTLAAETGELIAADENSGACHALFVEPNSGRGHVLPVWVRLRPAEHHAIRSKIECDPVAEAAANRAILSSFQELKSLGFANANFDTYEIMWWVDKPDFRCVGASLGLAIALATVAAYSGVQTDPGIAATGSVEGEQVFPVASVGTKWNALVECRRFHTLILSTANIADLPSGARQDNQIQIIDVPTVRAAILDVFGPSFGVAGRRLSSATQ